MDLGNSTGSPHGKSSRNVKIGKSGQKIRLECKFDHYKIEMTSVSPLYLRLEKYQNAEKVSNKEYTNATHQSISFKKSTVNFSSSV